MNKEMRQFIRKAKADGWKATVTGSGHVRLQYPGASDVICPSTPGDRRAFKNIEGDMRRAKKMGERR